MKKGSLHYKWFECPRCKFPTPYGTCICFGCQSSHVYADTDGNGYVPASNCITKCALRDEIATHQPEKTKVGHMNSKHHAVQSIRHSMVSGNIKPVRHCRIWYKQIVTYRKSWRKKNRRKKTLSL